MILGSVLQAISLLKALARTGPTVEKRLLRWTSPVMGCLTVAGSGNRDCMKEIMDSLKYQAILKIIVFGAKTEANDQWTAGQSSQYCTSKLT